MKGKCVELFPNLSLLICQLMQATVLTDNEDTGVNRNGMIQNDAEKRISTKALNAYKK